MGRRQEAEAHLGAELWAALQRRPLPDWGDGQPPEYLQTDHQDLVGSLSGSGSGNWSPLAHATQYAELGGSALSIARAKVLEWFRVQRHRFHGMELGRIYLSLWCAAVIGIRATAERRGDAEMREAANSWLRHLGRLHRALYWRGRVWIIGMRSAGYPPGFATLWERALWAIGTGSQEPNGWITPDYRDQILNSYRELVRAAWRDDDGADPIALLAADARQYATPIYVYRTEHGMAAWMTHGPSVGSTQAVIACSVSEGRQPLFGPRDYGDKARSRRQGASTVELVDGVLRYRSPVYEDVDLALPPGEPTLYCVIGREPGVTNLLSGSPASVPTPTPGPAPTPQPGSGEWPRVHQLERPDKWLVEFRAPEGSKVVRLIHGGGDGYGVRIIVEDRGHQP